MKRTLAVAAALAVLGGVIGGCLTNAELYPCDNPDKGHKDANGEPDPCHENDPDGGADGGDAGPDGGDDAGPDGGDDAGPDGGDDAGSDGG